MKITKNGDSIIVEIPLLQNRNNPYDEQEEKQLTINVVGVIAGQCEQGIYQVNDLSYKDATQLGAPLVMTYLSDDEFRGLCKELGIHCWEYEKCSECGTTLWGSFGYGEKGARCFDCEMKNEKR